MKKHQLSVVMLFFFLSTLLTGCGGDPVPFTYQYTSPNEVLIGYNGKNYVLPRFGPKVAAPFDYEFEADGDLDIEIEGKSYDIDSPYDIDVKKSKKTVKKPVKKVTSTKSTTTTKSSKSTKSSKKK